MKHRVTLLVQWVKKKYLSWRARVILYVRTRRFQRLKKTALPRIIAQKRSAHVSYALLEDDEISIEIEQEVMAGQDPERSA